MKTKINVADFFKEWTGTRPNLKVEFHDAGIEAMAFAEAFHNAETKANGADESASTCNLQSVIARYSLDADLVNDIPEMIDLGYRMRNGGVTKEEYERYDYLREMFETEFL